MHVEGLLTLKHADARHDITSALTRPTTRGTGGFLYLLLLEDFLFLDFYSLALGGQVFLLLPAHATAIMATINSNVAYNRFIQVAPKHPITFRQVLPI